MRLGVQHHKNGKSYEVTRDDGACFYVTQRCKLNGTPLGVWGVVRVEGGTHSIYTCADLTGWQTTSLRQALENIATCLDLTHTNWTDRTMHKAQVMTSKVLQLFPKMVRLPMSYELPPCYRREMGDNIKYRAQVHAKDMKEGIMNAKEKRYVVDFEAYKCEDECMVARLHLEATNPDCNFRIGFVHVCEIV
jgi:hypothetical protein